MDERGTGGAATSSGSDDINGSENTISSEDAKGSNDSKASDGIGVSRDTRETTNIRGFEDANGSQDSNGSQDAKGSKNAKGDDLENAIYMLRAAVEASSDQDGWAALGEIGHLVVKRHPDFDARNYGYKKLTDLVTALDEAFDLCRRSPAGVKAVLAYA